MWFDCFRDLFGRKKKIESAISLSELVARDDSSSGNSIFDDRSSLGSIDSRENEDDNYQNRMRRKYPNFKLFFDLESTDDEVEMTDRMDRIGQVDSDDVSDEMRNQEGPEDTDEGYPYEPSVNNSDDTD